MIADCGKNCINMAEVMIVSVLQGPEESSHYMVTLKNGKEIMFREDGSIPCDFTMKRTEFIKLWMTTVNLQEHNF